jgi:hypothetical protein
LRCDREGNDDDSPPQVVASFGATMALAGGHAGGCRGGARGRALDARPP